ncbi:adhesin [Micromonospora sp. WMMA1998]|uniref:adhesin n=1 Tax=Micromonospora sp. WMMA1998 TaxID=3015167 RepID=UPI00248B28E1|nr:adhesin [Micromonospora sp. WMMA1998]WBC16695.1 adhesin [Micromonospora sp. WMMA1998]
MGMPGEPPRQWATAGQGSGDVAYRMQGLRYGGVELGLDETVSAWTIIRLWLGAAVVAFTVWAVFASLALLVAIGSGLNASDLGGGLFYIGSLLSFVVFWVALLAARIDEPIAEWKTLVEDRYQAADSAYAAIYGTLRNRGFPVHANAVRIRSDLLAPEMVNNRLLISDRSYSIYVSVFPYGSSLYLGWTMWRTRRGATLIGHFIKDLIGGMLGRSGSVNQMLRTERVRAMREAVHAAAREGTEVAMQGVTVPLAATFGQDVPVQDLRAGLATSHNYNTVSVVNPAPTPGSGAPPPGEGPVSGPPAP